MEIAWVILEAISWSQKGESITRVLASWKWIIIMASAAENTSLHSAFFPNLQRTKGSWRKQQSWGFSLQIFKKREGEGSGILNLPFIPPLSSWSGGGTLFPTSLSAGENLAGSGDVAPAWTEASLSHHSFCSKLGSERWLPLLIMAQIRPWLFFSKVLIISLSLKPGK